MKLLFVLLALVTPGSDTLGSLEHQARTLCRYHSGLAQWEYFSVSTWYPGRPPELHADCVDHKTFWVASSR